jgi:hypothetical protein
MSNKQTLSSSSPAKGFPLGLQPPLAWTAILGLALFSILGIFGGGGKILRLGFPVGAFAVGAFLYNRYPILYTGFTWWIWLLTPLVRRLVDYRNGWDAQPLILLAPFLVTLCTIVTFLRYLPKASRQGGLPFVIAGVSVFYAILVGLIQGSPVSVIRSGLDWLSPVLFGFHLFVNWRDYPHYRQNMQRTFLWGVLVTGAYGVVQYLIAPEWDRFWLINSEMITAGKPEPFQIRVWSTLNGPGIFGSFMIAGLLILFNGKGAFYVPASIAGYLAFLLSLVRSAWGGWFAGLITLLVSLKASLQMRLVMTILVMAMCIFPLTAIEPFSEIINTRLQSISNLQEDDSARGRLEIFQRDLNLALSSTLGSGIGAGVTVKKDGSLERVAFDNGFLETLFTLGWFGAIPYLTGLLLILFKLFQHSEANFDPFVSTARAISIGLFLQLPFGNSFIALPGVIFWSTLGLGVAAQKYHRYQHQLHLIEQLPPNINIELLESKNPLEKLP